MLVARMLGRLAWGQLGIIQSTVGLFGTFAGFGMGMTATKFVAEFRKTDPSRAGQVIGLSSAVAWISGAMMAVTLFALASRLASDVLGASEIARPLRIAALLLFLGSVNGAQTGALSGFEAFRLIAKINAIGGLASFPLMTCGVWLFGLEGALWGLLASQAISCLMNYTMVRREARRCGVPVMVPIGHKAWRTLVEFSFPALLCSVLYAPVEWVCSTLLVRGEGGFGEMGLYSAANQWFGAAIFVPSALSQALLPVLSERLGSRDAASSNRMLWLSMALNGAVTLPLIIGGILLSRVIMGLYGASFAPAWPVLVIVLATAGVFAVLAPSGQFIVASGKLWYGVVMNLAWGIGFIALAYALVKHGAVGLASARLGAYMLHAMWSLGFVIRTIRQRSRSHYHASAATAYNG